MASETSAAVAEDLGKGDAPLCTSCDTYHDPALSQEDREAECTANRPICAFCPKVTCIQARANGWPGICLEHFFANWHHTRIHVMDANQRTDT
jgi:hypothetical protein